MRRYYRSQSDHRLGGRAGRRELHRAEPVARHSESPALQHQPVFAELDLLSQSDLSGRGGHGRFRVFRASRGAARIAGVQQEIAALRASEFVEYERVYKLKLRFLKLLFQTFLGRVEAKTAARGGTGRGTSSGKAICCIVSRCIRRWKKRFTSSARTSGTGGLAGAVSGSANPPPRAIRAKTLPQRSVSQVFAVAAGCAAGRGAGTRARAGAEYRLISRSGAGHRSIRLRSVGAPRLLHCRLPRGRAAGRILAQGAGLGLSSA